MKLIIIKETAHIDKYNIDDNTIVIGWDQEVCDELEKRKVDYKPADKNYNNDIAVKWIKDLARKKIDNKNLISLFEFKGTSLWWWMEYWLYSSYAYYDSFNEIIKTVYIISNIIRQEKPSSIIYVKEGLLIDKVIELISENLGIKTKKINSYFKLAQFKIVKKFKTALIKNFFDIRFFLRKNLLGYILSLQNKEFNNKNVLFVYMCSNRIHNYVNPILDKLKKTNYGIYALDITGYKEFLNLKMFRKKIKDKELNHVLLENYISRKNFREIKKEHNKFLDLWNSLEENEDFRRIFSFNGLNIWKLIKPQFSCYFYLRLKHHLINMIAVDNVIRTLNPSIAVTPSETTEFDKGLFLACQKRKIPSIGIQHGLLNDLRCIHKKNEVSFREINPSYCPIPSLTAVYSSVDKEFLIKNGNYPKNSVVVTGNQRYDPLVDIKRTFDKKQICSELRLDSDKKIIVLGTEVFTPKYAEILFKIVCDAVKKLDKVQFVVKVHPEESPKYYENLIKINNTKAIVIKYDIFKILHICDLLLIERSTIGLEAAIFEKPIIAVNLTGNSDQVDYVEKGIALGVYNEKDLLPSIKSALFDKKTKNKLAKNRKKYVYDHCYKIDGKSSERIAELVKKEI